MGWFDWLFKRKPHKPPPAPALRAVGVVVFGTGDRPVPNARVALDTGAPQHLTATTNADGYCVFPAVLVALRQSHLWVDAPGYKPYNTHLELLPVNHDLWVGGKLPVGRVGVQLPPLERVRVVRAGVVSGLGEQFVDQQGAFLPLGATLFWALRGWKVERERLKLNLRYLSQQGFDYFRVLCEVNWPGNETDPRWPDYREQLAGLIDYAYDELGLRTQLTIFGSGKLGDPRDVARTVADVVAPRPHKVMFIEVANEWWQNFPDAALLKQIGKDLRARLPNLVALSAPQEEQADDIFRAWNRDGCSNMGVVHLDRADNTVEWKWRHVRKPWEPRAPGCAASHNEPGGPRSSVAQYEEAIHLAMSRAVGILCGYAGYVLHNAAGVSGQVNPQYGGRPANVWEVPGIDGINAVVKKVAALLPPNPLDGTHTRTGLGGHPLASDGFIGDGAAHGLVRDYALVRGTDFWQTLIGIKDYVNLTANAAYALDLIDPVVGWVGSRSVQAGETFRLEPHSRDSRGFGAYIVRGRRT